MLNRTVSADESAAMHAAHIAGRLRGAGPAAVKAAAFMYTVTPDSGFVIDRHPDSERITIISACSGHGFKHSAGIGEAVAQMVCDARSDLDLAPFRINRFRQAA